MRQVIISIFALTGGPSSFTNLREVHGLQRLQLHRTVATWIVLFFSVSYRVHHLDRSYFSRERCALS